MNRDFLKQVFSKLENVDEAVMKEIIDAIMDENGKGINESKSKIDDLTSQLGLVTKERDEGTKLIEELKKSNQGNEELQGKIGTYETQLNELKAENEQLKLDNAIKVELLGAKAKGDDLDYLMFKIKQNNDKLSLTENGELKGFDVEEIKTAYPSNFEVETKKVVDVNNLPKIENSDNTITKEQFEKMGYKERTKLFNENPDVYNELKNQK
jgi:hypothetical protein